MIQAAKDDVDVINLSFGEYLLENSTDESDKTALINIYQRAVNFAHKQGSVVVASVGDEGLNLDNQAELKYHLGSSNGKDYAQVNGSVKDIPAELDNVVSQTEVLKWISTQLEAVLKSCQQLDTTNGWQRDYLKEIGLLFQHFKDSSLMRMEHQSQHQKYLLPWD